MFCTHTWIGFRLRIGGEGSSARGGFAGEKNPPPNSLPTLQSRALRVDRSGIQQALLRNSPKN